MRAPRHLIFGSGQRAATPHYVRMYATRVLVVTDQRVHHDPALAAILTDLTSVGISVAVFDGVEAELPLSCVERGAAVGASQAVEMVIGLGGGSCIDAAKVIALLLAHGGRAQDYYGELKVPGATLPVMAVPTTAGTGSEVTPIAVLDDPSRATKIGIASPHLVPLVSICDPELTLTCPPGLTAASGADALTHAIESFMTLRRASSADLSVQHVFIGKNALSDGFALQAVRLIGGSLEAAVKSGNDVQARSDMMLGSTLAGLAFGVSGTGAAHAIQYPVGALTHTPHGLGVASLMPYVMAWNRPACEEQLAEIGAALGASQVGTLAGRAIAAIRAVADLYDRISIPKTIALLGVAEPSLGSIAEGAMSAERLIKNSPRKLDLPGMTAIVRASFEGSLDDLLANP
ncbi:MAG: iron-containing alcohol dehydrogenase [Devosia sp.]